MAWAHELVLILHDQPNTNFTHIANVTESASKQSSAEHYVPVFYEKNGKTIEDQVGEKHTTFHGTTHPK